MQVQVQSAFGKKACVFVCVGEFMYECVYVYMCVGVCVYVLYACVCIFVFVVLAPNPVGQNCFSKIAGLLFLRACSQ